MTLKLKYILDDIQNALNDKNHIVSHKAISFILTALQAQNELHAEVVHKNDFSDVLSSLLQSSKSIPSEVHHQYLLKESLDPRIPSTHYSALDVLISGKNITLAHADHYDDRYRPQPIIQNSILKLKEAGYHVAYYRIGGSSYQYDEVNCMFFAIEYLKKTFKLPNFFTLIKNKANNQGQVSWHSLPAIFLTQAQGLRFFCRHLTHRGLPGPSQTEKWNSKNISLFKDVFKQLSAEQQTMLCFIIKILDTTDPVVVNKRTKMRNQEILKARQQLLTMGKTHIESLESEHQPGNENLDPQTAATRQQ